MITLTSNIYVLIFARRQTVSDYNECLISLILVPAIFVKHIMHLFTSSDSLSKDGLTKLLSFKSSC